MESERFKILVKRCSNMSRDELLTLILDLWEQLTEGKSGDIENNVIMKRMSADYKKLEAEADALRQENEELKEALLHTSQVNQMRTNEIYGRGTEKYNDILDTPPAKEQEDEAEQEEPEEEPWEKRNNDNSQCQNDTNNSGKRKKRSGWKKGDFADLPHKSVYMINIEELNQEYGECNWRIAYWHCHPVLEYVPASAYVKDILTPVISVGEEHCMATIPYVAPLWQRSYASPSVVSIIMYQKFALALPTERQERLFSEFGFCLSKQLMSNWILRSVKDYFQPIYDYLKEQLLTVSYHQCDETTLQVIRDGRKPGSKSYIWLHMTSELLKTPPIILFCFELTRGTDHLREFYQDFQGTITSDAYCSYQILGKEKNGFIVLSGCWMHARRRFATSLTLINPTGLDPKIIEELPETKAISLIGKIYHEDEPLKVLSAEERQRQREEKVKPLVEEYFNYIEGLDTSDPLMGERLKDAIQYSVNQKEYLTRFLSDGNIPLDNGCSERNLKILCLLRNASLFCTSIAGAEALAVMCSLTQTARANGANAYWYLYYILEKMPRFAEGDSLEAMMPWSEEYRCYERQRISQEPTPMGRNEYNERPQTPKKKNTQGQIA